MLSLNRLVVISLISLVGFQFEIEAREIDGGARVFSGGYRNLSLDGWACVVGDDKPVKVSLVTQVGDVIASTFASRESEVNIQNRCATHSHHRFKFDIPQETVFRYQNQTVFVEARHQDEAFRINANGPLQIPTHPSSTLKGFVDGVNQVNGAHFLFGWACQTHSDGPVVIVVTTKDENGNDVAITTSETSSVAESAVQTTCNTKSTRHRYRIKLPESLIDKYPSQPLFVKAISRFGDSTRTLVGSGKFKIPSVAANKNSRKPNVIVFFTDDQGYADLGIQNVRDDVLTPNIDKLAQNGARFTNGYITAPQCSPSRAAMITGMYQARFAMDENQHIPMTLNVNTLADRFKQQGYTTGIMGKWHLEIMNSSREWGRQNYPEVIPFRVNQVPEAERRSYFPHQRGFDDMFVGYTHSYLRNVDDFGNKIDTESYIDRGFRVDLTTDAATAFIDKNWTKPFYMHVAHYAPHVPLEAVQKYLDRFPQDMPHRRRYALALMAAVDDGVGKVLDKLEALNLLDDTLIFFISDNGAPLGDDMTDLPASVAREAWNGSRNDPFTGEKGMLTEGALRVPFIMHWPNKVQSNVVIDSPVSSLDAAYTAINAAGANTDNLDGMDLLNLLAGDDSQFQERPLFWRFFFQRAVRKGDWKYMQAGIKREYLFDMTSPEPESTNLIDQHPDIALELRNLYWQWANEMPREEPLVEIPIPFAKRVDLYLPD
jgi:arylsulfatase A-like enzyme